MSYERLYIHGAWDKKGSHAFPPADKGQEIDTGVVEKFDMIKGYSELFKVERRGSRFYYSYVRYNLISATESNRQGCNLGFTYVFDERSQVYVLNDLLGLREVLKQATDSLLKGKGIIIASDEDDRVTTAMQHIRQYTATASATKFIKGPNAKGEKTIAFDDATNEKIFAALEKAQTVIVSSDILTEAQRLAVDNQKLRGELEEKGKEIDRLKQREATLQKRVTEASKRFSNDVKSEFGESLKFLTENFQDLFGISSHPDSGETILHKKSMGDTLKELHPFFNTILLLVILIGLFVNSGKSEKEEPQNTDNKTEQQAEEVCCDKEKTEADSLNKQEEQEPYSQEKVRQENLKSNYHKSPQSKIQTTTQSGNVKSEPNSKQDALTGKSEQTPQTEGSITPLQEQIGESNPE